MTGNFGSVEYRVISLWRTCGAFCIVMRKSGPSFLRASINPRKRIVAQVLESLRARYGLNGISLFQGTDTEGNFTIVELLGAPSQQTLATLSLQQFLSLGFSKTIQDGLQQVIERSNPGGPFSQLGWIDTAITRIQAVTGRPILGRDAIRHLHGDSESTLLKVVLEDRTDVWMKAAGAKGANELGFYRFLSQRKDEGKDARTFVPALIGEFPDWNAWLMEGSGEGIVVEPDQSVESVFKTLEPFVVSLAALQVAVCGETEMLRALGAVDHSWKVYAVMSHPAFEFMRMAMEEQTSAQVAALPESRITELEFSFCRVCEVGERLNVPLSVLHGDLNEGNLLMGTSGQFIDWAETYVGCPTISLEHLLLLAQTGKQETTEEVHRRLRLRYREPWLRAGVPCEDLDKAITSGRILAPFSALYGQGVWLERASSQSAQRKSYARTIARHLDRAERQLREAGWL